MEDRERIKKLVSEGKINPAQEAILLKAFEESENRRKKVFDQVFSQKKSREKKILGVLSVWFIVILCLVIGIITYSGVCQQLDRDTSHALINFEKAGEYLEQRNYPEAVKYCRKGIKQSPRFSLGYYLLGSACRLQYEETKDEALKNQEIEAFKKAAVLAQNSNKEGKMNAIAILFTGIFVILVLAGISVVILMLYNSLVRKEERVNEAWAQILVQCQNKIDLVPVLLEVVKQYARHEKDIYIAVTEARSNAQKTLEKAEGIAFSDSDKDKLDEYLESQEAVSLKLKKLFITVENYPDLKANTNFLAIQAQLQEIEDKIVKSREVYNKATKVYNSHIKYFPANIIAQSFKFQPKKYFEQGVCAN